MSIQDFCSCFNQIFFNILSSMNRLYILNIKPLSVISFANTFSHSVGCLFVLSRISFAVQKLLSLIRSHLFISAFIPFALGDRSKKIHGYKLCQSVLPVFSSRSFMISFKSSGSLSQKVGAVLVGQGCCNKVSQSRQLKQQQFIFSLFWKLQVHDQGVQKVNFLWGLSPPIDGHLLPLPSHGLLCVSVR